MGGGGDWSGGFALHPFSVPALAALALSLVNLLWMLARFGETLPPERRGHGEGGHTWNPFGKLSELAQPGVTRTNVIYFLYITAFAAMEFTLTFLAVERFAYTPTDNAWMFVYVGLVIAFVNGGVVRRVAPRFGERKVVRAGLLLLIPGFLAIGWAQGPGLFLFRPGPDGGRQRPHDALPVVPGLALRPCRAPGPGPGHLPLPGLAVPRHRPDPGRASLLEPGSRLPLLPGGRLPAAAPGGGGLPCPRCRNRPRRAEGASLTLARDPADTPPMKLHLPIAAVLGLTFGFGFAQDPAPASGMTERLEALEQEVSQLKSDLAAKTAAAEEVQRYLAGEKERGTALLKAFDEAEQAGFTAGINYRSREILLGGLRSYVKDAQKGLPAPKKAAGSSTARR